MSDYAKQTLAVLRAELTKRNLPKSGRKSDIIKVLREDDEKKLLEVGTDDAGTLILSHKHVSKLWTCHLNAYRVFKISCYLPLGASKVADESLLDDNVLNEEDGGDTEDEADETAESMDESDTIAESTKAVSLFSIVTCPLSGCLFSNCVIVSNLSY